MQEAMESVVFYMWRGFPILSAWGVAVRRSTSRRTWRGSWGGGSRQTMLPAGVLTLECL